MTSSSDSIRLRSPAPLGSSSASRSFSTFRSVSGRRLTVAISALVKKLVSVTVGRPGGCDTDWNRIPSVLSERISPSNFAPLVRVSSSNDHFASPPVVAGCAGHG